MKASARAAFTSDGDNDGNGQPRHLAEIAGDGFSLAALFGVDAGIRAGRVNERQYRAAEFCRELHDAQCLAIPFGLGLAEIAVDALLGVASLLMADDGYGAAAKFCQAGDERFIVAKAAVAVEFDKVGEHQINPVESVGPLGMARNLGALPGAEVSVKLPAEFEHFPFQALDLFFALL